MAASLIWIIPVTLIVTFILYRLLKFIIGDADFTLLSCSLKEEYIKGKVVWVTGASSGIGEGLCRHLSRLGAKVILSSPLTEKDKLMFVLKSLAHPEDSRVYILDLSERESVSKAPREVKSLFGRVDILINNGGVALHADFINTSEDAARKLVEVDLLGTSFLTQGVLNEMMLPQGNGHIVNTISLTGIMSLPTGTYYCASKRGLLGLMDSLRYELLDKNISITNVCPAFIKTNLAVNAISKGDDLLALIEDGMIVDRCAELMLIATSNKLDEVWIGRQPSVFLIYLGRYMPSLASFLVSYL